MGIRAHASIGMLEAVGGCEAPISGLYRQKPVRYFLPLDETNVKPKGGTQKCLG